MSVEPTKKATSGDDGTVRGRGCWKLNEETLGGNITLVDGSSWCAEFGKTGTHEELAVRQTNGKHQESNYHGFL